MEKSKKSRNSIDEYILTVPQGRAGKAQALRKTIKAAAPEAEEKISYQMPTFYLKGNLVHFAALQEAYRLLSDVQRHPGF